MSPGWLQGAFNRTTALGWTVLFLCIMGAFLWDGFVQAVVESDRAARRQKEVAQQQHMQALARQMRYSKVCMQLGIEIPDETLVVHAPPPAQ
jgi:hypothetical protein